MMIIYNRRVMMRVAIGLTTSTRSFTWVTVEPHISEWTAQNKLAVSTDVAIYVQSDVVVVRPYYGVYGVDHALDAEAEA